MKLRICIVNVFLALVAWLLVVCVPGVMLTALGGVVLANMRLYDPITAPDHNARIMWGFLVVVAVAYVPIYRAIAKRDNGAV